MCDSNIIPQDGTKDNTEIHAGASLDEVKIVVHIAAMLADPVAQDLNKKAALMMSCGYEAQQAGIGIEDMARLAIRVSDAQKALDDTRFELYPFMKGAIAAAAALGMDAMLAMTDKAFLDEAAFRIDGIRRRPQAGQDAT